jgi:hypothetical protein
MKEQLQKPYYRQLNRVHDAVQFILGQMEGHDIVAVSMRTKEGLQALLPFTNCEDIEHTKLFNTILDTFPGANVDHTSAAKFAHDTFTEEDVAVFDVSHICIQGQPSPHWRPFFFGDWCRSEINAELK